MSQKWREIGSSASPGRLQDAEPLAGKKKPTEMKQLLTELIVQV
jgi:hypothetical protein